MNKASRKPNAGTNNYNAQIVAGSLLVPETRKIAELLLHQADDKEWNKAIFEENILQKRAPSTAKREAGLIKNRLVIMKPELWEMIRSGGSELATQATLACAIKHSKLLGDFMLEVIRLHWQTFDTIISDKDWRDFWNQCSQIDANILGWSETTQKKLKQVIHRILVESKYLESTRKLQILPVSVVPEVRGYLINNNEDYVLKCMEVTQ